MRDEINKGLLDIKLSIESIYKYLKNAATLQDYQRHKLVRRAVERELEIISDVLVRLLKKYPDLKIENSRKIVDARNWVINGYDNVDEIIIWGVLTNHLPKLQKEIDKLLP